MQARRSWRRCGIRGPALAPYHTNRFGAHTSTFRAPSAVGDCACNTNGWHTLCTAASSNACNNLQRATCTARRAIIARSHRLQRPRALAPLAFRYGNAPAYPVGPGPSASLPVPVCLTTYSAIVSSGSPTLSRVGRGAGADRGHELCARGAGQGPPALATRRRSALPARPCTAGRDAVVCKRTWHAHLDRAAALAAVAKRLDRATERQDVGISLPVGCAVRYERLPTMRCDATLSTAQR